MFLGENLANFQLYKQYLIMVSGVSLKAYSDLMKQDDLNPINTLIIIFSDLSYLIWRKLLFMGKIGQTYFY